MSAQAKIIFRNVVKVARNSGQLNKQIKKIEDKVIDQGLKLIEEAGIDPTLLPIDIRSVLRGESPSLDTSQLLTPEVICSAPLLTPEQKEETTRKIEETKIEIEDIYTTTQALKQQTLNLTNPIIKLQESTNGIANSVEATSNIIELLKVLAVPVSAPPGIGIPTGVLNTFSSTLVSLSDLVKAAASDLRTIPNALSIMTGTINQTISSLNSLNLILDPFVQLLTMVKSVVDLQDQCPLVSQDDLDALKAELLSNISGTLAQADLFEGIVGDDLEARLKIDAENPFFYKNFRFILENEPDNPYFFPSRRINMTRANSAGFNDGIGGGGSVTIYNINPSTNPDLPEGSYSYASSLPILVAEGKFAVDVYTNNITSFEAPQFRENIQFISDAATDIGNLSEEEIQAYADALGYSVEDLVNANPLPNYIRYGDLYVNLNSSPTDVEYGVDRLVQDGSYAFGSGLKISSYIVSGVIQVNKPITLRLRTFGGSGSPVDNNPRFTESLLTVKRSAAIQDDVNPFTGKLKGFDQSVINEFVEEYGQSQLNALQDIYIASQEITGEFSNLIAAQPNNEFLGELAGLNYVQRLRYITGNWFGGKLWGDDWGDQSRSQSLRDTVNIIFRKTQQLLYNENLLYLSKQLYGFSRENDAGYSLNQIRRILRVDRYYVNYGYFNNHNMYWNARRKSSGENLDRNVNGQTGDKVTVLYMFTYALGQLISQYESLYGDRTEYTNGSWLTPGTGTPLIPSIIGQDNEDVTVVIQESQLAGVGQEINENVGSLSILGTYTYDLEIIDSNPGIGGPASNYPTNYAKLEIRD